ncbi:hypothetical protein KSS87_014963 [Heliosperma pusillum]|nr:hypothetical protein KSS87_014963 [Heliosperma pusillum]
MSSSHYLATVLHFGIEKNQFILFKTIKTAILVGLLDIAFFGASVVVPKLALEGRQQVDALGFICAGLNVVMYGSPLAAMVPNGIGCLLGVAQLLLYAMYRNAKPSKTDLSEKLIDESKANLIPSSSQIPEV